MSDTTPSLASGYSAGDVVRPLSVRMLDSARAQLEILAQLNDRTLTEEVRLALEAWISAAKSDPKVLARAEEARASIEREASLRREAIQSIFDQAPDKGGRGRPRETGTE